MARETLTARDVNQTPDPFETKAVLNAGHGKHTNLPVNMGMVARLIDLIPDPPVYKAEEIQGIPFLAHSCEFRTSEQIQKGEVVTSEYVALNATLEDGRKGFITCGGMIVVQKLKAFVEMVAAGTAQFPVVLTLVSYPQPAGRSLWKVE